MARRSNDGIGWYLDEIGKIPMLSHEEELLHGRAVQAMVALREEIPEGVSPTVAQRRVLRTGERSVERMIKANLRLVVTLARKYSYPGLAMDIMDLVQEGNLGLRRAVEKYDPTRGYKFSTYAYWWIRQAITRSIAMQSRSIRLPINANDVIGKLKTFIPNYYAEHGKIPTYERCAEEVNTSAAVVADLFCHFSSIISLDKQANNQNDQSSIVEFLKAAETNNVEDVEMELQRDKLHDWVETLPPRERDIIIRRHGLHGQRLYTQAEIAREQKVSRQMVSDLEARALRRLRFKASMDNALARLDENTFDGWHTGTSGSPGVDREAEEQTAEAQAAA